MTTHQNTDKSKFKSNSRYEYEFARESDFSQRKNRTNNKNRAQNSNAKNDDLARGSNISGAFSNPLPVEFGEEVGTLKSQNQNHDIKSNNKKTKERFQEDLQQNYNVELSDELLINKNKD